MFALIRNFFLGVETPVPQPTDIIERIEHNLKGISDETIKRYNVRKAMSIKVTMSSTGPRVFAQWLSDSSRVVDLEEYIPDVWKGAVRVENTYNLDDFMTHNGYVVNVTEWLHTNKPRIARLVSGFNKLKKVDRDYYQRNYNSVLRDVDAFLQGVLDACN